MTAVVLKRVVNVESVEAMKGKRASLGGSFVNDDTSARNR